MAERAEPVPTRTGWAMLPVLRRMAAMPLKDPFAFTGLVIYVLFALVALFADQLAPLDPMEILFIKAGKLLALGVTTSQQVAALPDVPTIASVVPGYEASSWFVIVAPAATPEPIIAKLNAEGNRILKKPEVRERFAQLGADPIGGTPQDLGKHIAAETAKWKEVVRVSGAQVD